MTYFLAQDGQQQGPFEEAAIRRMAADGNIAQTDLIWTEGMAAWTPVSQVFPKAAAPPPPPPPPPPQVAPVAQLSYTPAAAVPVAQPLAGGPVPPAMHWFLVLLIGSFTLGLFSIVWAFVIASFVKKVSPRVNGRGLLFAVLGLDVIYMIVFALAVVINQTNNWDRRLLPPPEIVMSILGGLFAILLSIMAITAFFRMRRGLLDYYNSTENIGLRLSGAMTFFFNIYYLQYHLTRIANWKKTGQLTPQ